MKKASFYTLGCKVNQYETEAMEELFINSGYEIVDYSEKADVYVINTCSVTNMSDRKSRQIIRRAKKTNPYAIVAVTGCYAQTAPDEVSKIDGVNLIIGTKDRKNIVKLIEEITPVSSKNVVGDIMHNHEFENLQIERYTDRTRAYIKIQEGCSQFCSYCIIPYARGPIRSRSKESIIDEIKKLSDNGFSEIILTGIHVASYGKDLKTTSLDDLILEADKIDGIKRIRLSSIEPMTLNSEFVEKIKKAKKLCPHFHLSLQSGCDETLKRMNRRYTTAEYKEIVDGLRNHFDDVAVTTDIMVGFAGETEEEFQKTLDFVNEIEFSDAHVFQYSIRKGTPAEKFPNQIDPETKAERSKIIIDTAMKSRDKFLKSFEGRTMDVLFEQEVEDGIFEGKTANYITVRAHADSDISGQFKNVQLKFSKNGIMTGKIID